MIEKLLLTFGIATALSLSAPDAAAAPKGGDLTGDAFLKEVPANKLYEKFRTPDSSSKLFARWWWNGTRVCEKEIVRELDSMQRAGFGGVEINSIASPTATRTRWASHRCPGYRTAGWNWSTSPCAKPPRAACTAT